MTDHKKRYERPMPRSEPGKAADTSSDEPGVEFAPGVFADHVLRQEGWSWLEDFLGVPLPTILKRWTEEYTYNDASVVFVALLLQRNRRMREADAFRMVNNLSMRSFDEQVKKLGCIGIDAGIYQSPRGRPIDTQRKVSR